MSVKLEEISAVLKERIKNYQAELVSNQSGRIISIGDGIAYVSLIDDVMQSEILVTSTGVRILALNLQTDGIVGAFIDAYESIKPGDSVQRTKQLLSIPVGDELLGRIINPLGEPLDGLLKAKTSKSRPVERVAPGVMARQSVDRPLSTGLLVIDALVPIGKGQRELIIGDRQTGKTAIAIDAIINQKGKDVLCIYVGIGQKNSTIVQLAKKLQSTGAMAYTTIVASSAADLSAIQYLAPYSGVTIAEEWMEAGKDVLIIYDDLSKHAVAYRTMSLLLRRPPGREAYPGDVFYLHSRLLERAGRLNAKNGGGSITALPIVETQAGDISAYIPTNVISITDGQIFMQNALFNQGQRPAVDVGLSVSRVGSSAQIKPIRQVASSLRLELAQHAELESFSSFGSDVDEQTRSILEVGNRIKELLKQHRFNPYDELSEALILYAIQSKFIRWIPLNEVRKFKTELIKYFRGPGSSVKELLGAKMNFDEEIKLLVNEHFKVLVKIFTNALPNYDAAVFGNDFDKLTPDPELWKKALEFDHAVVEQE